MRYIVIVIFLAAFWSYSCSVTKKVKDGETAYALKQYAVAIDFLEDEYDNAGGREAKSRKAFLLGNSYDILQKFDEAVDWYEKAKKDGYAGMTDRKLASAYKKNEQYDKALALYTALYKKERADDLRSEIQICKDASGAEDNNQYNIIPFTVNTEYNEYSPVLFGDEYIVFTSDREGATGDDTYKWTGNNYSDIYVVSVNGFKVNNFDALINSNANEGTACFSQDLQQMFFTRCESIDLRNQHCRIYFTHRPNGFWQEPEPLMFFDEKTNFAHPCLIENDSVLIFSAAPSNGDGTYDLFYSEAVEGGWSSPELMPSSINSIGNEKFPTADKDTLYFASDGLPGYGGYDLFMTYLNNGKWATPKNLGIPLNSGADDFGLIVDPKKPIDPEIVKQGYFTSSRNQGSGDDIFFYSESKPQQEKEPEEKVDDKEEQYKIYVVFTLYENEYEDGDPNKSIINKNKIANNTMAMRKGDRVIMKKTDAAGRILFEAEKGDEFLFQFSKKDYFRDSLLCRIDKNLKLRKDTTINFTMTVDKITYDKEITLDNIYYDYDKWDIREDAKPALDSLANILTVNPGLYVQLSSHTDCRGDDDYNVELSSKRAASAVAYLVTKGIRDFRLRSKGYGESVLIDNCNCDDCSEEAHQRNRRTTFTFLSN